MIFELFSREKVASIDAMLSKVCRIACACTLLSVFMINTAAAEANYDESKTGDYKLPDPLVLENGEAVKDAKTWREKRRPELLRLFETHVYGKSPGKPENVYFKKTSEDKNARALGSSTSAPRNFFSASSSRSFAKSNRA